MSTETVFVDVDEDPFRPTSWDELIGQSSMKVRLTVAICAATMERRRLDDVLLTGPPGVGKTSTGRIIANAMNWNFVSFVMPVGEKVLLNLIHSMDHAVVLLDEIHRAPTAQQESLLTLIEDQYYQDKRGNRHFPKFLTFIGATTERKKVIEPLRDRFTIQPEFEDYTDEEMGRIVMGMARRAGIEISTEDCEALGRATGGVPRNARSLVLARRDLTLAVSRTPSVPEVLSLVGLDDEGMNVLHHKYLRYLQRNGVAGLSVLASVLQDSTGTVENLEKLLVNKGYVTYSPQGRELTQEGFAKARAIDE